MQWRNTPNAGFTEGTQTWLKVNPNFDTINVEDERQNPHSIWHFYQKLIHFRQQNPVLTYGTYCDLLPDDVHIYAFTRTLGAEEVLIIGNFSSENQTVLLPVSVKEQRWKGCIGNYEVEDSEEVATLLRPFEGRIFVTVSA
jgi:glycosidase